MTNAWITASFPREGDEAPPGLPRHVRTEPTGVVVRNNQPNGDGAAPDQWVAVGPSAILHGSGFGHPTANGRVRAVQAADGGLRAYVGSGLGGVWYTDDGGATWLGLDIFSTTSDLSGSLFEADALAIGALAVQFDPNGDVAQDLVFVGTGERRPDADHIADDIAGIGIRQARGPVDTVRTIGPDNNQWTTETGPGLPGAAVFRMAFDAVVAGRMWAATTKGLFRRGAAGAWAKVEASKVRQCTDVVVVPVVAEPKEPDDQLIFAAFKDGTLVWSHTGDADTWTPIVLGDYAKKVRPKNGIGRIALAVARKGIPNPVLYVLSEGPRLWRVEGVAADLVFGVPSDLLGDQGEYDMAIAAHPGLGAAADDQLAMGGSSVKHDGFNDAALYKGAVHHGSDGKFRFVPSTHVTAPKTSGWIGQSMHPDVHAISWVSGPSSTDPTVMWIGCDGGVYRSPRDGTRASFTSRSSGLPVTQSVHLAGHPAHDGVLLLGTQDNGGNLRTSGELWYRSASGDAGGVAVDPLDPSRMYAQTSKATWQLSVDGGESFDDFDLFTPPRSSLTKDERKAVKAAQEAEAKAAAFYSSVAVVANRTGTPTTQVALGTDRVWYTDGPLQAKKKHTSGWVTLPSAKDPYDGKADRKTDVLDKGKKIRSVAWADKDTLYVLNELNLYRFTRAVDGKWSGADPQRVVDFTDGATELPSIDDVDVICFAVHDVATKSVYVGTLGRGNDHVWWFDGVNHWMSTGLKLDGPIYALVVDPLHPNVVYAGGSTGVWRGTGTFPAGSAPTWAWTHYSDALPEAAVTDLQIYSNPSEPTNRLLRVATAGRGVWELALDGHLQGPELYLRSHRFDTRRLPVAAGGAKDPFTKVTVGLDASPDVRVWRGPTADPPPFPGGKIGPALSDYHVWLLQSALRAAGQVLDVTGSWGAKMKAALAARQAELSGVLGASPTAEAVWKAVVGGNRLPFDHDPPDLADLTGRLLDEPDERPGKQASCVSGDGITHVYVAVHSRHWKPVAPDKTWVTVLKTRFGGAHDLSGTAPLLGNWRSPMVADITNVTPTGLWLANTDWSYLDSTHPVRQPTRAVEQLAPPVVSFDVDLAGAAWPDPGWLLLAIVHSTADPLTTDEIDVATLVRTDRHVAARSVRRFT